MSPFHCARTFLKAMGLNLKEKSSSTVHGQIKIHSSKLFDLTQSPLQADSMPLGGHPTGAFP
jgi:hypothetical protein